ncbi:MAG TPA: carboxypeptidase regulatory-like domain-containing protein [Xanthobacteraceae bacterium]|nr:carboxypeptidase regulatory-like domain-containing protein [Xanthobacteraceae bacterium]
MRATTRLMLGVGSIIAAMSGADAATISGTVTGPDGQPFRGAFVQARNLKTKITVSVLSDNNGRYRVENLLAGEYRLQMRAIGFKADPKSGITLAADQNATQDLALQQGMVRWSDISMHQGKKLLPEARGKEELFTHCMACHGFESRMAAVVRDEDGWRDRVNYMKDAMGYFIMRPVFGFNEHKAENVISYLNQMFGENSKLPKSPADLPQYQSEVRPISDEGLKIVYVEYDTPGPNRMPWSAHPDKDGTFWVPYYGRANKIANLNPVTGEMTEYPVPNMGTAAIHSAVPHPDGSVWLTEQGSNKLGRWDPRTKDITEYQDTVGKHTVRIDPKTGMVWSTGALSVFDPKTKEFTHIPEVPTCYGIALDQEGNAWFTELTQTGKVGKVDAKTLAVTKYTLPTVNGRPRRIEVDDKGIVWFGEFDAGRIGRLDPKTGAITEFQLPGPQPTPYALGIDRDGMVWYSSEYMDVIGRLDPNTGKVVEYPYPRAENSMRDFFMDDRGRMWFGSPVNDKVGYFYVARE